MRGHCSMARVAQVRGMCSPVVCLGSWSAECQSALLAVRQKRITDPRSKFGEAYVLATFTLEQAQPALKRVQFLLCAYFNSQ